MSDDSRKKARLWVNKFQADIIATDVWEEKLALWKASQPIRDSLAQRFPSQWNNLSDWWDEICTEFERDV